MTVIVVVIINKLKFESERTSYSLYFLAVDYTKLRL